MLRLALSSLAAAEKCNRTVCMLLSGVHYSETHYVCICNCKGEVEDVVNL